MLFESLLGQHEYTTQLKGSFWCHVIDTRGAVLLLILLNKSVLVLSPMNNVCSSFCLEVFLEVASVTQHSVRGPCGVVHDRAKFFENNVLPLKWGI